MSNVIYRHIRRKFQNGAPVYEQLYRVRCLPDAEWQRCKLESLRYKWGGYKHGVRFMQTLGDFGRKYFGGMAAYGRWNR